MAFTYKGKILRSYYILLLFALVIGICYYLLNKHYNEIVKDDKIVIEHPDRNSINMQRMSYATHGKTSAEEESLFTIEGTMIKTIYGVFEVKEKVILDLINSPVMQRLKKVQQYGITQIVERDPSYTRYAHCLGVWALLRRFDASLHEQIAGLLHDASHTVFSHVGDFIFNHKSLTSSYQDDIHGWFLQRYKIDQILQPYGISLDAILHKNNNYTALEQDLPDLCADRLEYNLRGGLVAGIIKQDQVERIIQSLRFADNRWFFIDAAQAAQFARISLNLTEHLWGAPGGSLLYAWTAEALKRALALNIVSEDDIHFSTDDKVWDILVSSKDPVISMLVKRIINYKDFFEVVPASQSYDRLIKTKFRGINPWVLVDGNYERLTDVDSLFRDEFNRVKQRVEQGWYIRFTRPIEQSQFGVELVIC